MWWCRRAFSISSRNYQKLVAKIEGKPEERILSYLMLRSLKQARYSAENRGPFRAGGGLLYALHFAHPALSGPDRASPAEARGSIDQAGDAAGLAMLQRSPKIARNRSGAPPTPSANWWSGRKSEVHGGARWAKSSRRWSSAPRNTACLWNWKGCSSRDWCRSTRCRATATLITRTCARSWASARGASSRSAISYGAVGPGSIRLKANSSSGVVEPEQQRKGRRRSKRG